MHLVNLRLVRKLRKYEYRQWYYDDEDREEDFLILIYNINIESIYCKLDTLAN